MEIGDNNNDNGNVKYNKFLWIFDFEIFSYAMFTWTSSKYSIITETILTNVIFAILH